MGCTYCHRDNPEDPAPALCLGKIRASFPTLVICPHIAVIRRCSPNGPKLGPTRGPIIQEAMARPRRSCGIISAMDPAPRVIGHDAAMPEKKRNAMRPPRFGASAHAILKIKKMKLQTLYTITRPYSSDKGAMSKGPKVYPRR